MRNSSPEVVRPRIGAAAMLLLAVAPAAAGQEVVGRVTAAGLAEMDAVRVELRARPTPFELVRGWAPGEQHAAPLEVVRPRADGGFRLEAPAAGMYRVVVRAPGRVAMQRDLAPLLGDVALPPVELPVLRAASVRVVDPAGAAVGGARLSVRQGRGELWQRERLQGWRPVRETAVSDDAGRAAVPFAEGEWEVLVGGGAPGWWGGTVRGAPDGGLELVLEPGVERRVEVIGEGRPMKRAAVWVGGPGQQAAVADEAGTAPVTLPAGVPVEIRVETAEGWRGRFRVRVEAPGEEVEGVPLLRLTLEPPARLAGRVVGAVAGEPVAGALVWLVGEEGSAVVAAEDGRFVYPLAGSVAVDVRAAAAGYERQHLRLEVGEWPRVGDGLVLPLAPFGVVAGTVLDPEGRPVPDATVLLRPGWRQGQGWDPGDPGVESVEVDADGRFRFSDLSRGAPLWLRAAAPGRPAVELESRAGEEAVRLVLGLGGSLRARVRTGDGGRIENASARLFAVPGGRAGVEYHDGVRLGGLPAEVAEDGALHLGRVPSGMHELVVEVAGHQPLTVTGIEVAEGVETDLGTFALRPEVVLEGRVVDPEGRPIAGADVVVEQFLPVPTSMHGRPGREIEADEGGHFRVGGLVEDLPLGLAVRADGFLGTSVPDLRVPREAPLEVRLGRGASVFGQVVDESGRPLPGASLIARVVHEGQQRYRLPSERETASAVSDEEGRFELTAVPVGPVSIGVSSPDGGARHETPATTLGEGERFGPLRIELPSSAEIAGRVVRADGAPAAGASVTVRRESPDGGSHSTGSTADALGRFRVGGLRPGPFTVVATLGTAGRCEEALIAAGGVTEIELVLEPTTAVTGRLVAADGSPVGRADARLEREGGSVGLFVDQFGRFESIGLDEGTYHLVAEAPGVGRGVHPEPIEVRRGRPVEGLVLRLAEGARVAGRVIGLAEADLAHLQVSSWPAAGGSHSPGRVRSDGSFEIRGLGAGSHFLQVVVQSTGQMERLPFEVEEGAQLDGVEVDLSGSTLTVTATVLGQPLDGRPWLFGDGAMWSGGRRLAPGRFAFAGLDPGRYRFSVLASPAGPTLSREVEVAGDQEAAIDFEGWAVTGTALDEGGQPVPGVVVWVVGPGEEVPPWGPGPPGLPPDAGGRFELPAVPPGTWRVVAGGGPWWGEAPVEVPPGGTTGVALTLRRREPDDVSTLPGSR